MPTNGAPISPGAQQCTAMRARLSEPNHLLLESGGQAQTLANALAGTRDCLPTMLLFRVLWSLPGLRENGRWTYLTAARWSKLHSGTLFLSAWGKRDRPLQQCSRLLSAPKQLCVDVLCGPRCMLAGKRHPSSKSLQREEQSPTSQQPLWFS